MPRRKRGKMSMRFLDRTEAAQQLAKALRRWHGQNPLVLAIPRGAVPMAKIIADELEGEVDVVLVRKLRAPHQAELAIGAVDETGWTYLSDYALQIADSEYIEAEKSTQMEVMRQRRAQYTPIQSPLNPADRAVIVVDDGLATGSTMIAALHAIRARKPRQLICAVPVSSADTLKKIKPLADEVICLTVPDVFYAVGQFYSDFPQVSDEEVVALLRGG
jgi:putative phosphoribosyl transferase